MLHNDYTQNIPFFKGLNTKYFEEDESTGGYKAFIEMPVKEHHCPNCGHVMILSILVYTFFTRMFDLCCLL